MSRNSRIIAAVALAFALVAGPAVLGADNKTDKKADKEIRDKSVAGTVIGKSGKPLEDVEVRALRVDVKQRPIVTMTALDGVYILRALPPGTYSITASVDGLPLSRAQLRTPSKGWIKLDFDLRKEAGDTATRINNDVRTVIWYNVGNPH